MSKQQYNGVDKSNQSAKKGLKQLQKAFAKFDKMGVVVLSYQQHEMHEMPVVEALHNKATEGLIALGKAVLASYGRDDYGNYRIYGLFVSGVYLRFLVRGRE